jgi:hypothetical protein
VISGQKINAESGLNLADKASLSRAWDIHAERGLKCTDCHYSLNNPIHCQEPPARPPSHLLYDPRRLEIGEYFERPDHTLARGAERPVSAVAPESKATMRRCESCHRRRAHPQRLAALHRAPLAGGGLRELPRAAAARAGGQSYDWTVLHADGAPVTACRGIEGHEHVADLVTGFQPVLMQRTNSGWPHDAGALQPDQRLVLGL